MELLLIWKFNEWFHFLSIIRLFLCIQSWEVVITEAKEPSTPAAQSDEDIDIGRLDFRVGRIVEVSFPLADDVRSI